MNFDSNLDLNLLPALDALLSEASVAGAARRLRLSASAMSRTLSRLRESTGDPLLVRAGRAMVLTPHAEALRGQVHDVVHDARALLRPATAALDLSTLHQTFTIRANESFVEVLGADLLSTALTEAPGVRFGFVSKPEKTATPLREGAADLEIGVLGEMGPEVRLQALFRDRYVGVVRKGHPLENAGVVSAEAYADFGHVVVSRRGVAHGPVDKALADLGLARAVISVVQGFSAALAVARASDLIALVPASCLNTVQGMSGEVVAATTYAFDLPVKTDEFTVSQMWHPRMDADPAHRWLRQLVLKVCRRRLPS